MSTLPLYYEFQNKVTAGVGYARTQLNDLRSMIGQLESVLIARLNTPAGRMKFGILDSENEFVEKRIVELTTKVNEPLLFAIQFDWDAQHPHGPYTVVQMFAAGVSRNVMIGLGTPDSGFFSLAANVPVPLNQVDFARAADDVIGYLHSQVPLDFPTQ